MTVLNELFPFATVGLEKSSFETTVWKIFLLSVLSFYVALTVEKSKIEI